MHVDGVAHAVRLPTAGRHNVANALGVIGACLAAGHAIEPVLAALVTFALSPDRMPLSVPLLNVAVTLPS